MVDRGANAFFFVLEREFTRDLSRHSGRDRGLLISLLASAVTASVEMVEIQLASPRSGDVNFTADIRTYLDLALDLATGTEPFLLSFTVNPRTLSSDPYWIEFTRLWLTSEAQDPSVTDLAPVQEISGPARLDFRQAIEPVLGPAQQLLLDGAVPDEIEADVLRTNVEWLNVRVIRGDPADPLTASTAAGIVYETAAIISRYDQQPSDPALNAMQGALVRAVSSHRPDDPDLVSEVADEIEQASRGRVTRRDVLLAFTSGTSVASVAALIADVGAYNAAVAGGSGLVTTLLTVVALTWRRRGPN